MKLYLLLLKNLAKFGKLLVQNFERELIPDKTVFLNLLESLAKVDETVVREQAAKSLTTISKALTDAEIQNVFAPMVIRLA